MYATPSHVHNGHNLPHYNNHYPNPHQAPPPPPPPSQRSAPAAVSKEPITVVGIPSVSIQNNHLVVGTSQSSESQPTTFSLIIHLVYASQVRRAPTLLLKSSAMGHSVRSGCAIGMGRYPPIPHFPPCSVEQGQDLNGQESGS